MHRERTRGRVPVRGFSTFFLGALLTLVTLGSPQARPWRPAMIPNGSIKSCSNCHLSRFGGGARNPFGEAVMELVTPGGFETFWSPELAALDSDGDGFSNGVELGDPSGLWAPGDPPPGDAAEVTNPGDPEDRPPGPIPAERFRRGDFNTDGSVNISDAIGALGYLFGGSGSPLCLKAVDSNGDGSVNISDPTYLLNSLFAGGAEPPAPFPDCGTEPENDATDLDCEVGGCS